MLEHLLPVPNRDISEWIRELPACAAVFALLGRDAQDKPYISKTANLRKRVQRLLMPSFGSGKRLFLGDKVSHLTYSEVGSDFETYLLLLRTAREHYGDAARKRLHLRPPALLRLMAENAYPRVYVTNRIVRRSMDVTYGPFASRNAAERFLDDSLNLFELRRCTEELHPDPAFPGCVYSEMKMCLAPCFRGCTDERYSEEVRRVRDYFSSNGALTIAACERERETASAALDFEKAAQLHQRVQKLKAVTQQAAPLVHPLAELNALIVQPAAGDSASVEPLEGDAAETSVDFDIGARNGRVAIFLVRAGGIFGPAFYSVEGMRHPNEQAGSTSLFAHPALLEPTPLEGTHTREQVASGFTGKKLRSTLENRLQSLLDELKNEALANPRTSEELSEHLSLLSRWYYRTAARRTGEIFFEESGAFQLAKVLRGISRVYCGQKEVSNRAEDSAGPTVQTNSNAS